MGPPVRNSRDALARSYLNCECVIRPRQRIHRCFIYNRLRKALPQLKLKVKQIPRAAPSSYLLQQGIFPAGRGKSVFPFPLHQQEQLRIPQRGLEQQGGSRNCVGVIAPMVRGLVFRLLHLLADIPEQSDPCSPFVSLQPRNSCRNDAAGDVMLI